jgi:hypothetical protein
MPHVRPPAPKLSWFRALVLVGLPVACATGVEPEPAVGDGSSAGTSAEAGSESGGGSPGSAGTLPLAGTTVSEGGKGTAFGGTTGQAGKAGSAAGGAATAGSGGASGGKGGSSGASGTGGAAGRGGSGGGTSGGSGGSGGGTGGCTCANTLMWVDNTTLNFSMGDCVTTMGKTYLYTGTKMQTYALGQCNPTAQETWCPLPPPGNGYSFMACL